MAIIAANQFSQVFRTSQKPSASTAGVRRRMPVAGAYGFLKAGRAGALPARFEL